MATKELDIIVKLRDAASRGLKTVKTNVKGVGTATTTATKGLSSMYTQLIAIAGVVAGGALFGKAIKDFAAFDDNMRAAGAVTGATRKEMELMTETAERMGRETRYTASQSAEALRFLGMAGFEASEAVGALPGTLELAAAGMLDLGQAADITTNVLSAYGLEVSDLGRVNDVLVKTFTSANVNLVEIGEAFKIVGPIAKGVGSNFEDLVGAIGALGNAGIKGTLAGTALKGSIAALLNPTKQEAELMKGLEDRLGGVALKVKDSEGDFIGFEQILKQLEKAGLRGDEALELFGLRAGPGMAALLNMGSDSLAELIDKLEDAGGTAADISSQMEAGIGGEIRKTISVLESFRLKLGDAFGPEVITVLQSFRVWVGNIIDAITKLKEDGSFKGWGEAVVEIFGVVNTVVAKTYHAISGLTSLIIAAGAAITGNFDMADAAMNGWVDDMNNLFATTEDPLKKKAGKLIKAITKEMYDELAASTEDTGPIGKGTKKVSDSIANNIVDLPSIESKMKAGLIRLNALLQNEAEQIEGDYDQGLINLNDYYDQRAEMVQRKIQAEIAILSNRAASEDDVSKREILNAQIYAKQQELDTELLKLTNDRVKAQDDLDKDKLKAEEENNSLRLKAEQAYQDQKERIKEGYGVTTLDTQFADELAKLQTKQNDELAIIKEYHESVLAEKRRLKAAEAEIEAVYSAQATAIKEQQDLQAAEKAQLIADQDMRLQEYRLGNLKTVAQGTAQIFEQLYEATGAQSKELFYIAKAAAIAEATVNVAQGVTKALAQGGIYGIVTGALVAAAGAVQIGTILSQSLAEGGEVQGHSPNSKSDNIPAMLTAKEFVQPVASVQHYGKDIMEGLRNRSIPRAIFSGYSSGGYVKSNRSHFAEGGLVSGPSSREAASNGEGKQEMPNIVNVLDPSVFEQYTASQPGQRNILNVMAENIFEVKQMLSQ